MACVRRSRPPSRAGGKQHSADVRAPSPGRSPAKDQSDDLRAGWARKIAVCATETAARGRPRSLLLPPRRSSRLAGPTFLICRRKVILLGGWGVLGVLWRLRTSPLPEPEGARCSTPPKTRPTFLICRSGCRVWGGLWPLGGPGTSPNALRRSWDGS